MAIVVDKFMTRILGKFNSGTEAKAWLHENETNPNNFEIMYSADEIKSVKEMWNENRQNN